MKIAYVKRNELDTARWNQLLAQQASGLIYANSNYLDLLTPSWDAMIMGDFEAIMPLPYKTKLGFHYLTPPPFVQQLGIIGNDGHQLPERFMAEVKKRFRYGSVHLNFTNPMEGSRPCNNFILDLNKTYSDISASYTYYLRKQTRNNPQAEMQYRESDAYQATVDLYHNLYGHRFPHVPVTSYSGLVTFATTYPEQSLVREVWKNNELLSAVLCLKDNKRIYLVVSLVTENGQKLEANRFLLDQLIREHAGRSCILDFEGSDLPGVAAYYKGFGAINQPYYRLHWNHLFKIF